MVVERQPGGTRLLDVLDRVLDKGIVIDAWIRFQLVGIDLITIDARIVVASIETYLNYAESLRVRGHAALPELTFPQSPISNRRIPRARVSSRVA
jgi:gas vesicle structural protein